jgi:hypothetical protein
MNGLRGARFRPWESSGPPKMYEGARNDSEMAPWRVERVALPNIAYAVK